VVLTTHALHIDQQLKNVHKIIKLNFNFLHFLKYKLGTLICSLIYVRGFALINLTSLKLNFVSIKY